MPRVGRIYQRALCYHVMNRAVNRGPLFSDDADREYFSGLVAEYKEICGSMEGERAVGTKEFAATLKMERGRYRVKRGRPRRRAPITLELSMAQ